MNKFNKGFTLIELLIVVVILLVLGYVAYLIIDPVESGKKARDAQRMSDLQLVFKAVHVAIDADGEPSASLLCGLLSTPCTGTSLDSGADRTKSDGSGWVKTKIDNVAGVSVPKLPIDPTNIDQYVYIYKANKAGFEVNGQFESKDYQQKMKEDGGDNDLKFELGTNLTLIN